MPLNPNFMKGVSKLIAENEHLKQTYKQLDSKSAQFSQLAREDLEQIDPDDLEEMDLHWEMAMLKIKARRFIKRTGRKQDINGQRIRFDWSKVECYNCHKNGHFARECRAPRNQENRGRKNGKRTIIVETPTENDLIAQDRIGGYDWSYQAKEEHPTNFALMAYTSSGSSSNSDSGVDSCSKTCVKAYATLKEQYDTLNSNYNKSQFNLVSYKAVRLRDNALVKYKKKLEKAEKERDKLKLTLEKFQNSSKSLNNLLKSQVSNKFKTGLGYNAASSTVASPAVESFVNSSKMLENQEYNNYEHLHYVCDKKVISTQYGINSVGHPTAKDSTGKKRCIDSGCSRHMTGNKCFLSEYEDHDGGLVYFGDGKENFWKVKSITGALDFDNVLLL
ncbi:ribonuclease H-like domain-containing protein [Tanacetum coccineum]